MWSIGVLFRLESDPLIRIESAVRLPVTNYPIWSPAALALDGYPMDSALIFDFQLIHPRGTILIRSLSIPVGRLTHESETSSTVTRILNIENVSVSYFAFKYREDFQWLGQIHISVISIKYDIELLIRPAEGDRIALQCGEWNVERCQQIIRGTDVYRWTSGSSHRHQFPIHMIGEPIDSADYSNPHHLLPRFVGREQQFAILNYRFTPPTAIPFIVRFGSPAVLIQSADSIDGKMSIPRRRIRERVKYQVYSLKKHIGNEFEATFYYTFARSIVQIQLIELKRGCS